jgi:hypothetical protein
LIWDGKTKDLGLNNSKHFPDLICSWLHHEYHSQLLQLKIQYIRYTQNAETQNGIISESCRRSIKTFVFPSDTVCLDLMCVGVTRCWYRKLSLQTLYWFKASLCTWSRSQKQRALFPRPNPQPCRYRRGSSLLHAHMFRREMLACYWSIEYKTDEDLQRSEKEFIKEQKEFDIKHVGNVRKMRKC